MRQQLDETDSIHHCSCSSLLPTTANHLPQSATQLTSCRIYNFPGTSTCRSPFRDYQNNRSRLQGRRGREGLAELSYRFPRAQIQLTAGPGRPPRTPGAASPRSLFRQLRSAHASIPSLLTPPHAKPTASPLPPAAPEPRTPGPPGRDEAGTPPPQPWARPRGGTAPSPPPGGGQRGRTRRRAGKPRSPQRHGAPRRPSPCLEPLLPAGPLYPHNLPAELDLPPSLPASPRLTFSFLFLFGMASSGAAARHAQPPAAPLGAAPAPRCRSPPRLRRRRRRRPQPSARPLPPPPPAERGQPARSLAACVT